MSDLALTLLLLAAFFGGLTALGLALHWIFYRLAGNSAPRVQFSLPKLDSPPVTQEMLATNSVAAAANTVSGPAAVTNAVNSSDGDSAYRARMKAVGVTVEVGDELRMGWFEMVFKLAPAIAGIEEVWTLHGRADFTEGDRCLVISDGLRLVILDRWKNHGLRLELSQGWFECSVTGSCVRIWYHRFHGRENVERVFTIEAHASDRGLLVPDGWPGTIELIPSAAESTN